MSWTTLKSPSLSACLRSFVLGSPDEVKVHAVDKHIHIPYTDVYGKQWTTVENLASFLKSEVTQ